MTWLLQPASVGTASEVRSTSFASIPEDATEHVADPIDRALAWGRADRDGANGFGFAADRIGFWRGGLRSSRRRRAFGTVSGGTSRIRRLGRRRFRRDDRFGDDGRFGETLKTEE
jgi:hypothetical protein